MGNLGLEGWRVGGLEGLGPLQDLETSGVQYSRLTTTVKLFKNYQPLSGRLCGRRRAGAHRWRDGKVRADVPDRAVATLVGDERDELEE